MNTQVVEAENCGMWDIRRKPLDIHVYGLNTVSEYPWDILVSEYPWDILVSEKS